MWTPALTTQKTTLVPELVRRGDVCSHSSSCGSSSDTRPQPGLSPKHFSGNQTGSLSSSGSKQDFKNPAHLAWSTDHMLGHKGCFHGQEQKQQCTREIKTLNSKRQNNQEPDWTVSLIEQAISKVNSWTRMHRYTALTSKEKPPVHSEKKIILAALDFWGFWSNAVDCCGRAGRDQVSCPTQALMPIR